VHVGIDIEQFVRDPQSSGIQRVLQQLARHWPTELATAVFVAPHPRGHVLLTADQAAALLSLPFEDRDRDASLRQLVTAHVDGLGLQPITSGSLLAMLDRWLLPEVSYLASVLERLETFAACMPTSMIGYDALPMTEPENYRFAPGAAARVNRYFQRLTDIDTVVCISDVARDSILDRLRRDPARMTSVAHPGGDHLMIQVASPPPIPRFVRVGTLEARKQPIEILRSFQHAVAGGWQAELVFVGAGSPSDPSIDREVRKAVAAGMGVTWVERASDTEVRRIIGTSSAFLAFGVEGYGIPVLEAIRLGTPVLFDGVQPAAELMVGLGAARIDAGSVSALSASLSGISTTELDLLRTSCDPTAVPRWRAFAEAVAEAAVG